MSMMPVLYVPKTRYTSDTSVLVPVLVAFARAGAIAMLEWLSLRFVENAPLAVCVATGVFAVAVLAILQTKDWLDFKGKWYFRGSLLLSAAIWCALVGYGYWAYPPNERIIPTFPTADEIAAAIARNLPKTPSLTTPAVQPAPPSSGNDQALNQMRQQRDQAQSEVAALRQTIGVPSPFLHFTDAKYWQLVKAFKDSMPGGRGATSCGVTLEYNMQRSSPEAQKTAQVWGELTPILIYAGWNFIQQNTRTFFPPGIAIFVGNNSLATQCAVHLKEFLDGLNVTPNSVRRNEETPVLQGRQATCIEVSLGKLETP